MRHPTRGWLRSGNGNTDYRATALSYGLTQPCRYAFIPRPFSESSGVLMTRPGGRAGRKRKPEIRLSAFGAGTKNRPVERREAQRPAGRPRKPAGFLGARASRAGLATRPFGARQRSLASSVKGSRKPLAPPGAPCPLARGERKRRDTGDPAPVKQSKNRGGGALAARKTSDGGFLDFWELASSPRQSLPE